MVLNLFAFRHTDPRQLESAADAVGPADDDVLQVLTSGGRVTVAAWGAHGRLCGRSREVVPLLAGPHGLGVTRHGEPRHPLYVPADTELLPWTPEGSAAA